MLLVSLVFSAQLGGTDSGGLEEFPRKCWSLQVEGCKEVRESEVLGLNLLVGSQVAILLFLGCGCLFACLFSAEAGLDDPYNFNLSLEGGFNNSGDVSVRTLK